MTAHDGHVILHDARRQAWRLFQEPLEVRTAWTAQDAPRLLREIEQRCAAEGLYAAGFVSYEAGPAFDPALQVRPSAGFPFAWFGLYRSAEPFVFPQAPVQAAPALAWTPSVTAAHYRETVGRIRECIRQGETYQVNYTFRLRAPFEGDAWDWFARMVHAQGACHGAFLDLPGWTVCSASPELFFTLENGELLTRPMKGTARRGLWSEDDQARRQALASSEKDRAENVMIVDMARHDLGRIAQFGSVVTPGLFDLEAHPTVWQMTSTVRCATRAGLAGVFDALFPAASITGAPKNRTMGLIARLESDPRGLYTGAIGFLTPSGRAQFNVAIRTLVVDKARRSAEYGVGGGIVWDSTPEAEYEECAAKAAVLACRRPAFDLLETLLWTPQGGFAFLERHLARLGASAVYFSRQVDLEGLRRLLAAAAAGLPACEHRIRVTVPETGPPVLEARPLAPLRVPWRVAVARAPVESTDPFLHHKTTRRQVYDQARAAAPGSDDVLLWNERGELTESCIANVVVERDGMKLTPPRASGLLGGVARAALLESGEIAEAVIPMAGLPGCARFWLVNSVRGMWEVFPEGGFRGG